MKLWQKGVIPEHAVIEFTSGKDRETDLCLARWDIVGSMAHVIMLEEAGLVHDNEKREILKALYSLLQKEEKGAFRIEEGEEDIHSQVEKELTELLGPAGKKIHTGRSRNDQVLVDIRLYTREAIDNLAVNTGRLFEKLQNLSEEHSEVMIPGYTHMQPAMVSSFGLCFGAWAECLADDIVLLSGARSIINRNPLGTAAGYGTTLPLNRQRTTSLLEFDSLLFNSAYASLSRGKAELAVVSALASFAQTLSRFSMEVCLFMTSEFRFIDFPDELVTGSSIMPQKRNPDVFELVRGRMNLLQALPGQVSLLISNLPSGYNRDLQQLKSLVFDAFGEITSCVDILLVMLDNIKIRSGITENQLYNTIFSTEEVNRLVKEGVPFRDAYRTVGEMIKQGNFPKTEVSDYTHEGTIGNLCNSEIAEIFKGYLSGFKGKTAGELAEKLMREGLGGRD